MRRRQAGIGALPLAVPRRLAGPRALAQRWEGRIFFVFADQAVFSASNSVLTFSTRFGCRSSDSAAMS